LIEPDSSVIDVGSGAGLPGVVLAIARPDLHVTLVDSMLRRTTFLDEVVADLGLANVVVRRARAEELRASSMAADAVTARAVASIDKLAAWARPLLRPGGALLALKGESAVREVSDHLAVLRRKFDEISLWAVSAAGNAAHAEPRVAGVEAARLGDWVDGPYSGVDAARAAEEALGLVVRLVRGGRGS